jgi:hypothetical protein
MPYYVPDNDRELAEKLVRTNVCAECGRRLYIYLDMSKPDHPMYVGCSTAEHEGIAKEYQPTRFQKEGLDSLTLKAKEETMSQEHGERMTTAISKSGLPLSGALTKTQAMELLKLVYPNVPEPEIIRTAMLCRDFGLHPLMKEVYIIPFGQGDKRTWSTVLGINATRKIMARMGSFSYIDNTPRVMTEQEQKDIFGEVYKDRICAITKLETKGGLKAQGYGHYLLDDTPYGMDKGNTRANMAFIRSERQASSRLFPDAIPQEIEVIDEAYVEGVGLVNQRTGQIIEGVGKVVAEETKSSLETAVEPVAEERPRIGSAEYAASPARTDLNPEQKDETPITDEEILELGGVAQKNNMMMADIVKWCIKDKGWAVKKLGDLKKWQFDIIIDAFEQGKA